MYLNSMTKNNCLDFDHHRNGVHSLFMSHVNFSNLENLKNNLSKNQEVLSRILKYPNKNYIKWTPK